MQQVYRGQAANRLALKSLFSSLLPVKILERSLSIKHEYLGKISYTEAVARMEAAIQKSGENQAMVWGLEHPLTYTSGLKTEKTHILARDLKVEPARRGGSVTLHNPGQLVVYFVFPLSAVKGGLERFVRVLESCLAETLLTLGVKPHFLPGASGVFTTRGKIAFIGLGLKKGFIYHGIALNVANDLSAYRAIQSCGLILPMTSIAEFNSAPPALPVIFDLFFANLAQRLIDIEPAEFRVRHGALTNISDAETGFRLGWIAFHERRYWEAHEIWEFFWHEMPPDDTRLFFHALIQMAMAWYKLFDAPNITGAHSLLGKALEKFRVVPEIVMLKEQGGFMEFLAGTYARMRDIIASGEAYSPEKHARDLIPPIMEWV